MLRRIIQTYGIRGLTDVSVPWFDEKTGMQNFVPHEDNVRHHDLAEEEYEQSILVNGVVAAARGNPFAVMSPTETGRPYRLISWGTLSRCFYRMAAEHPSNPNIIESLAAGVPNLTVLHLNTPVDCYTWLRDMHNHDVYSRGSAITFKQSLESVERAEADWDAHMEVKGLTSRTPKLSAMLLEWLNEHTRGEFASANAFEAAKILKKTSEALQGLERVYHDVRHDLRFSQRTEYDHRPHELARARFCSLQARRCVGCRSSGPGLH
jgi:hypothetical protein